MEASISSRNLPILQQLFIRRHPRPIRSTGSAAKLHISTVVQEVKPTNKMICCGGTEEDTYAAPASRHPAAPRSTSQYNAGKI